MISMAEGSSWLRTRIRGEVGVDDLDLDPDLEGQEDHDPRDPGLGQGPREETKIPNPDQGPNLGIGQGPKERDPSQGPDPSQETKVALRQDPDQGPPKEKGQGLSPPKETGPDLDQSLPKETGQDQDPSLLRGKDLGQDQSLLRETSLDPDLGPGLNL